MTFHTPPSRCAAVLIDLQNDFCNDQGGIAKLGGNVTRSQQSIPKIEVLLEEARQLEVPIIFVRTTHGPWFDTPAWLSRGVTGGALDVQRVPLVQEGTWGAEFYGVHPRQDDLVITKHRYSAFAYTPLELALRAKRRDTILIGGTVTNVCVEATAMDALMRGFFPILVPECASAASAEADYAARAEFEHHIGSVAKLDEVLHAWRTAKDNPGTAQAAQRVRAS
jgi:ureidoacrylate peracid hydrolase